MTQRDRSFGRTARSLFCCACLIAGFTAEVRAQSLDREALYQAALPNYADLAGKLPATHVQATTIIALDPPNGDDGANGLNPTCRLVRFTYVSTMGARVPALLYVPAVASAAHPVPCMILLHGLGGSKEQMSGTALGFARLGIASLAIDEYNQGERATADPAPLDAAGIETLLKVGVPQTVVDVRRGIDLLSRYHEVDTGRIGLLGVSLGAMIGTVAAGVEPRIKTTVLVSGGGDWGLILKGAAQSGILAKDVDAPGAAGIDWGRVTDALAGVDPLTFGPHIAPRSLLMECGRLDTIVAPQSAEELYDAASAPDNANVHIDWYANSGHVPAPELIVPVIVRWLSGHL